MEEWRPVVGYEGLYEVSSTGLVRSVDRCLVNSLGKVVHLKGKILKGGDNGKGYRYVFLQKDGTSKNISVHRLVAEAFIPRPEGLYEVNHKDEDKSNNSVDNLEWCDHKYNMNYGSRMEKTRETKLKTGSYSGLISSGLSSKEYSREYYKMNREKILEQQKEYHKMKREKYYQDHKEEIEKYYQDKKENRMIYMKEYQSKYQSKYYQDHKEERRIYMREYQRKRRLDK